MKYIALLIALFPALAFGSDGGSLGARSAGLAGANSAVADDIMSIFSNPGGTTALRRFELAADISPQPFGLSELRRSTAVVSLPLAGVHCALGGTSFGYELYKEVTLSASAGASIEGVGAGLTMNLQHVSIDRYGSASAVTVDAGVLLCNDLPVTFGCSLHNIGRTTIGEAREPLPQSFSVGCSLHPTGAARIFATLEKASGYPNSLRCGIECSLDDLLVLRCGIGRNPSIAAGGIGIRFLGILAEYAMTHHDALGWSHEFCVTFSWGGGHE